MFNGKRPRLALVVVATIVAVTAWNCSGRSDDAISTVRMYDLVKALPKATLTTPQPDYIEIRSAVMENQQQRALFMHPTSTAEFPPLQVGLDSVLTFLVGLEDAVQDKPGDGVEFTVSARLADGSVVNLFSRYVDPRQNVQDRGWIGNRVPLGAFAGQAISIILSTSTGPKGDSQFDWALWGEPRVVLDAL